MTTFGSLFAGIGGLDLGLERAGMVCKWQVENDKYATRVLERHWPDVRRWGNIKTFQPDESWAVDLICGGFPCQPVSQAGKRQGDTDERWLWDEMRRVCEVVRPRWVLAENVPGLLSASSGRLFGTVVRDLADLGYCVEWDCVSAASVGAPHIRDRVFILAHTTSNQKRLGYGNGTGNVADPSSSRRGGGDRSIQQGQEVAFRSSQMADANGQRCGYQPKGLPKIPIFRCSNSQTSDIGNSWWATEPDVGRVAHGVPARVDRLRTLGNAVVPAVAQWIGNKIIQIHQESSYE